MRKITVTIIFFLVSLLKAQSAYVSVSGIQHKPVQSFYSLPSSFQKDQRYEQYQQMIKNDYAVQTKYYTDGVFHAKVDVVCQTLYSCNSPFFFERVWARCQMMQMELPASHQVFLQTMQHEFAARYFDSAGRLINTEYDDSFGHVCADFFKWTFNEQDYQSKLNVLHDLASLELIAHEKKGFFGRAWQVISTTVSNVPERLFSVFKSTASPAQVRDKEYNKNLVQMIEDCTRGEFSKAEKFYMPGDQLMDKLWDERATICSLSGGTSEQFENPVDTQQLKVATGIGRANLSAGSAGAYGKLCIP